MWHQIDHKNNSLNTNSIKFEGKFWMKKSNQEYFLIQKKKMKQPNQDESNT